jgi:uncharacterized protein YjeT (DUF2065 family)
MKLKLIAAIGELLDSILDIVGVFRIIAGLIILGLLVAVFAPLIVHLF